VPISISGFIEPHSPAIRVWQILLATSYGANETEERESKQSEADYEGV